MKILLGVDIVYNILKTYGQYDDLIILFNWIKKRKDFKYVDFQTVMYLTHIIPIKDFSHLNDCKLFKKHIPISPEVSKLNKKIEKDKEARKQKISSFFDKKRLFYQITKKINREKSSETKFYFKQKVLLSQLNAIKAKEFDLLITDEFFAHYYSKDLSIKDKVYTIDSFIEKCLTEDSYDEYGKNINIKKESFDNISLKSSFFSSFKEDYSEFEDWFNSKKDEKAYVAYFKNEILAFLYIKVEGPEEDYSDIKPAFKKKKRIKIGSFKVSRNGFKLGEKFLRYIFSSALELKVEEIYVTLFNRHSKQQYLINLLEQWGFSYAGKKNGKELVYVRNFEKKFSIKYRQCYPYQKVEKATFIIPLHSFYQKALLPNKRLDINCEREPFKNAIRKVLITRKSLKSLERGSILLFYNLEKQEIFASGLVEEVIEEIASKKEFLQKCRKRSIFDNNQLDICWNYDKNNRPNVVKFLYSYMFEKPIKKDTLNLILNKNDKLESQFPLEIPIDKFKKLINSTKYEEDIIIYPS